MKTIKLLVLCSLLSGLAFAQAPSKFIYGGFAANAYKGDLSGYDKWSSSFHIGLKFNRKERINGNVNIAFGNVTGQNPNYQFVTEQGFASPNRFFKTRFFSLNYDLQINIIKKNNIIVYASPGIGVIVFNPEDQFFNKLIDQPSTREEGEDYTSSAIMLPLQVGIIYFLPNDFGIGFNLGLLNSQTDYLDNISLWGNKSGNDNIMWAKFSIYIPFNIGNINVGNASGN